MIDALEARAEHLAQVLKVLKESQGLPAYQDLLATAAKEHRMRYLSFVEVGFNDDQAFQLMLVTR